MKNKIKNFYYIIREISQGSGRISLTSISLITFLIYSIIFFFNNKLVLSLLFGKINKHTFPTVAEYLHYLESCTIDSEINILVPVLTTMVLLIVPTIQQKTNIAIKLLPTSNWLTIMAWTMIIICITTLSIGIVQVLDYGIKYYLRAKYLTEIIALQESIGVLYKGETHNNSFWFLSNFKFSFNDLRKLYSILMLSLVLNTIIVVMNLLFKKYSMIKTLVLIILVFYLGYNLRVFILDHGSLTTEVYLNIYNLVYFVYFPILFICFLCSFYYLLKQKEG